MSTKNPNVRNILMVVANPAVSEMTGWPIGFWWSELTHPYWEFVQRAHKVTIVSPKGGDLEGDRYSDPEHESGYSAHDFVSLGFKKSKEHAALLKGTKSISKIDFKEYDSIFVIGGQSPMYTMVNDENLHKLFAEFYEAKKIAAIANADHTVFVSGNDAEAKGVVVELLQGFGWKDITDLGDI